MKEIVIDSSSENQRFDKFLKKYFANASGSFIYKMLRKKNITLNGKKDSGSSILKDGDIVNVYFSDETFSKMRGLDDSRTQYDYYKSLDYNLDVIYEDDDIIAVNKPAGILSQKSKEDDISINEYIIAYLINERGYSLDEYRLFHPSVSNRLDYNTTGVMLAAKTLSGQQELSQALKERTIDKYYICIVTGTVNKSVTLTGRLTKDEDSNVVTVSDELRNTAMSRAVTDTTDNFDDSVAASNSDNNIVTEVTPIAGNNITSLLKIHLVTGKTHQIRAHLAYTGNPIIGDIKYGNKPVNEAYKAKYGVTTQLLHSYITFYQDKEIKAPLPAVMQRIIEEEYGDLGLAWS